MRTDDIARRRAQSWRSRGFSIIPNLVIVNPSLPATSRLLYQALAARCFGKGGVKVGEDTIGRDIGYSRQTVSKHLRILRMAGLVSIKRRGRGLVNVIKLALAQMGRPMKAVFDRVVPTLPDWVLDGEKRTVAWWLGHWKRHQAASLS